MKLIPMVKMLGNVVSSAQNLMAVGKSLTILTISVGLLSACSAQNTLLHTSESSMQVLKLTIGQWIQVLVPSKLLPSWNMNLMTPHMIKNNKNNRIFRT